ncbi:hypothetical protein GH984_07325 [Spiribacter sp. C176]|uniref:Phenylacetate--CoA ligase family protein n=1 Tax=Spiribacter salilacus TaxID=2664894 RepID=A0A6N7QPQ1_9GAMM|nr:hypothetical protein [Spiribacter salilacus]MRH78515.1 hypothetical protein [Spiribacter salilacus]
MSGILPFIKKNLQEIPYPIGKALAYWRYDLRPGIGIGYSQKRRDLRIFEEKTLEQQKRFIFEKVKTSLVLAATIPIYKELWASANVQLEDIHGFEDLKKLPIISKEMLRETALSDRSRAAIGRYLANTGGTSGNPLGFYITPKLIPNEWAHMHRVWEKLGYRAHDLKLVISGRNLGTNPVAYDGLRHSLVVNIYAPFDEVCDGLRKWIVDKRLAYLHGYPSAVAEFGLQLAEFAPDLLGRLRGDLKGAFLGSEYPAPLYRQTIEDIFQVGSVSWYGHTERCVLAWERDEPYSYYPFHTYGFAEAIWDDALSSWRLIATSYGNYACPFIRYDTGDLIEPVDHEEGLLRSFRIKEGRVGDFITDKSGHRISLTGLIFGRHHKVFDFATHVQVRQKIAGELTVFVAMRGSLSDSQINNHRLRDYMDLEDLNLDIEVVGVEKPFRTSAGKIPLKVSIDT